jgi:transposase
MFSFHFFLEKRKFKCENTNTKLYIVTDEDTSKTCTFCDNVGSSEVYKCKECMSVIDMRVERY